MHPLLVVHLASGFSHERVAAASSRRTAKAAKAARAADDSVSRPRKS